MELTMHFPSKQSLENNGFTLVEVMVALVVFSLGMLGIVSFTANGLKLVSVNQARATAIHAASQVAEPVFYHSKPVCLDTMLRTFPRTVTSDNGKDSYTINLVRAVDGSGAQIATSNSVTAAYGGWVSPVTIVLSVPYVGLNNTTVIAYPTYTMVLQDYTAACNA